MKQKLLPASICVILMLFLSAVSLNAHTTSDTIIITNSATFPPFSFLDSDGQPKGLLIDLWSEWARQNNHKVKFLLVDWNESFELIRKGDADIHAGLFKSESRKSFMDFSKELFQLTTCLFISTQVHVSTIEELRNVEVGVTKGGFEEEYLCSNFSHLQLRLFDNNNRLVKSALSGKTVAFVADYPVGMYYLHHYGAPEKFRILKTLYSNPIYSAVQKGDKKLLTIINSGLQQISKNEKERILQKWIRSEQVLPSWFTPFLVIAGIAIAVIGLLVYIYILKRNKMNLKLQVDQRTAELREKNVELEKALTEVKKLSGLLPICANCKKIRDDKGYWNQIELYIRDHSEVEFSHSICPECAKKLYPEFYDKKDN